MVPPEAFSISSAQALVAGTSGCAGGTHSDTFMLTVLSCASAGVTLAASSKAKNAFLIDISPSRHRRLEAALCGYCYRIQLSLQAGADCGMQPAVIHGSQALRTQVAIIGAG